METVKRFINFIQKTKSGKLLAVSIFAALTLGLAFASGTINTEQAKAAGTRDCDANAIMHCGALTRQEFTAKYKQNAPKDLSAIYSAFGLSSNELDRFNRTVKMGQVYKDGRIVVNGKVVGVGAQSLGRQFIPGSQSVRIGGKTLYLRPTSVSFRSNFLSAFVLMNGDQAEAVILHSCGNPVKFKPTGKPPVYRCDALNRVQVNHSTYRFTTNATAASGAKVAKVVYEFGDGVKVEKTNPAEAVNHTYKDGNYTAKVTVFVTVNGQTKAATAATCAKPVTVKAAPVYACEQLNAKKITRNKCEFTVVTSAAGGATLKDASFNFGDGKSQNNVAPTTPTSVITEHEYAAAGNYTTVATVNFNVEGGVKSVNCQVNVTVDKEPCPYNPELPKDSPECVQNYACTSLSVAKITRTNFRFSATKEVKNAEFVGWRFVVKNSNGQEIASNQNTSGVYEYSQDTTGNYSVEATLVVKVGGQEKTHTSDLCKKPFEVDEKEIENKYACQALNVISKQEPKDTFEFNAVPFTQGKVSVKEYHFDFGDGQTVKLAPQQTSTTHTYTQPGQYTAKLFITFEVDGQPVVGVTSKECEKPLTIKHEVCPYNPQLPKNSPECKQEPCPYNPELPKESEECQPPEVPEELPATGPAEMLSGVLGLSGLVGATRYYLSSRRRLNGIK